MVVKEDKPKENDKENIETPDKSKDETSSKVTELEKKLGDLSETLGQQNEFIQSVAPIINAFAFTPELKKAWDQYGKPKMVGEGEEPGEQPKQDPEKKETPASTPSTDPAVDKRLDEVSSSQREEIV